MEPCAAAGTDCGTMTALRWLLRRAGLSARVSPSECCLMKAAQWQAVWPLHSHPCGSSQSWTHGDKPSAKHTAQVKIHLYQEGKYLYTAYTRMRRSCAHCAATRESTLSQEDRSPAKMDWTARLKVPSSLPGGAP